MKRRDIPVILNADEAEDAMTKLKEAQHAQKRIIADHGDAIAELEKQIKRLDTDFGKKAEEERLRIRDLVAGIYVFAQQHRRELLRGKGKTARLPRGSTIEWHLTPGKAVVKNEKRALAFIEQHKLDNLVITEIVKSFNKTRLRAHITKVNPIPGVKLEQYEQFKAKPAGVKKPAIEKIEDLKRAIR